MAAAVDSLLPNIRFVLDSLEPYRRQFSAAEWKAAIRAAFEAGCYAWISEYLPKRFTGYARKLGYHLRSNHFKRKRNYNAPEPLVWTGETQESVLNNARVKLGGSAKKPYGRIPMRLPGPRHEIVVQTLSAIRQDEMGPVARTIEREMHRLIAGSAVTGRRKTGANKGAVTKRTFTGATSSIGDRRARQRGRQQQAIEDRQAAAEDRRVDFSENREARSAAVQRRTQRTHDRWRRQAGGSAPTGGASQSYRGSKRYRHAQAQQRYRQRIAQPRP